MTDRWKIAVADDEAFIRRYFQEVLPDLGHEVVAAAANGAELIAACHQEQPDLIITDIRMPEVDGIEAALRILAERPTPVILVSAFHDDDLVQRAAESHAMAYLVKPIERPDLEAAIPMAWHRFQQIRQLEAESAQLRQSLADRKLIEQAKGLLMKDFSFDEAQALKAMQKMACDKNKKLIEVARMVLAMSSTS